MIPKNDGFEDFEIVTEPSRTYCLDLQKNRIGGYCDGLEAVKQAVYKALFTERYNWLIYSCNYGAELIDLFGQPMTLVCSKLQSYITDALLQDDRIQGAKDFSFEKKRGSLHVTFKVDSTEGVFESEVNINV